MGVRNLHELYLAVAGHPSPVRLHLPGLRQLAASAPAVVEFSDPLGWSTVALLAGRPLTLDSFSAEPPKVLPYLERWHGDTDFRFSLPPPPSPLFDKTPPPDLLFLGNPAGLARL